MEERRRRVSAVVLVCLAIAVGLIFQGFKQSAHTNTPDPTPDVAGINSDTQSVNALQALGKIAIKGRAPKTGYTREQFSSGWESVGSCDVRNIILTRDMQNVKTVSDTDCMVQSGTLDDPYTGKTIQFSRGVGTSSAVQIDHVVALSDAWQTGAQLLSVDDRLLFANDGLNLLAVDGPANQQKSDGDAATWLPSNKSYRCRYVARQIAVKLKYTLWVTQPEHTAMQNILKTCPDQILPLLESP